MKRQYKLVAFDLDGTIVDGTASVWSTLHQFFGIDEHPERIALRERFRLGKITYGTWAVKDIELLKRHGADRASMLQALSSIKLMKGARKTLETLKAKGCKLAVVSWSLQLVLEKLLPDYEKIFDHVYVHRLFFNSDGSIKNIVTDTELKNKAVLLREICRKEGISPDECVFVGDYDNDVEAAELAGFSIAFNSKSERLNAVADAVIEKKDLEEILKYL
jgi:HAD superfamily phosphoserine phosphatase-like hydrolase